MGSRIREKPKQFFKLFVEVVGPAEKEDGWILQKFPDEFEEKEILKSIPMFCFPTGGTSASGPVQHFCFVMTDMEGKFTFGFCRMSTDARTCLCVLSYLPWHDLFYKLLNYLVDLMTKNPSDDLIGFLRTAYQNPTPCGGEELHIIHRLQKVEFQAWCPDLKKLPSIPENRAVTEYFNAVDLNNMITIFASLLNERRIIITSKKLGRLTACVMACNTLLYPMHWQHIFVTVLPQKILEHVTAPMPYIIGIPSELMPAVMAMDLGEVVIVDADENRVTTPHRDVQDLPAVVISSIRSADGKMFGDGVARAFMRALVELIGGYRFGLTFPQGEKIRFEMEKFIRNRPANLHSFLTKLVDQQIFRQFVEERLDLLNNGEGFSDEFEQEVSLLIDHESDSSERASIASQYRRWSTKGGNLLRSVTSRMKDRSKEAVKGLRSRMQDINVKDSMTSELSNLHGVGPSFPSPGSPNQRRLYSTKTPNGSLKSAAIYLNTMNRSSASVSSSDLEDAKVSSPAPSIVDDSTTELLDMEPSVDPPSDDALINLSEEEDHRQKEILDLVYRAGNQTHLSSTAASMARYPSIPPAFSHRAVSLPREHIPYNPQSGHSWITPVPSRSVFYGHLPVTRAPSPSTSWNGSGRPVLPFPSSTLPANWGLTPRLPVSTSPIRVVSHKRVITRPPAGRSSTSPNKDSLSWQNFE